MYAKVHPTVTVKCHPSHQADGGSCVFIEQTEEQRNRHRVRGMTAAEAIQTTGVNAHQMHRIKSRFMRRTQTANKGFEDTAAEIVTQSDSDTEADQDQQNKFPVMKFLNQQNH